MLHDNEGKIRKQWQRTPWITCLLKYKGQRLPLMSPGCNTQLFFLDEATALTAGHRLCARCRRGRFNAFREAWAKAGLGTKDASAPVIDARLHEERLRPDGTKRTFQADIAGLPDGVFVWLPGRGEDPWLLWNGQLLAWSAGGYRERLARPRGVEVTVLTPPSTVAAIRAGYVPEVHETAG